MKGEVLFVALCFLFSISNAQSKANKTGSQKSEAESKSVSSNKITSGIVKDIDGNVYKTITINHQTWMKENLRVTHFSNGDSIGTTKPDTLSLDSIEKPLFQWAYLGDIKNAPIFGRLYTWYVVTDPRNVCPTGWHVPSDEEFCLLENTLEANSDSSCNIQGHRGKNQGAYLKEEGLIYWRAPNLGADNRSAFSALPAGIRYSNGLFHNLGSHAYFWTTNEVDAENGRSRRLYYDTKDVNRGSYFKRSSLSVRCLKDG